MAYFFYSAKKSNYWRGFVGSVCMLLGLGLACVEEAVGFFGLFFLGVAELVDSPK